MISIPPHVLHENVDGQVVLLNLETKQYFMLNEVGTYLFEQIAKSGAVDDVYTALEAQYDIEPSTLRVDVDRCLEELVAAGLVAVR